MATIYRSIVLISIIILSATASSLNIIDSHPWGDDFAQYIQESINIVHHQPLANSYLVPTQYTIEWQAPRYYPPGLPLILAPATAIFGNQMKPYIITMSLVYFLLSISFWYFLKHHRIQPLLLPLIFILFIFNPWLIYSKAGILSDIPYTLASIFFITLFTNPKITFSKKIFFIPIMIILISTRSISFTIPIALGLTVFWYLITHSNYTKFAISNFVIYIIAHISTNLVNTYYFQVPSLDTGYLQIFGYHNIFDFLKFITTPHAIFESTIAFFSNLNSFWPFSNQLVANILTVLFLSISFLTLIQRLFKKQLSFLDFYFLTYLAVLITSRVGSGQGFRLMLPIVPVLIFYFYLQAQKFKLLSFAGTVLLLLFYIPRITNIQLNAKQIINGPQKPSAIEMFKIVTVLPQQPNGVIIFYKARALGLYTSRLSHPVIYRSVETAEDIDLMNYEYSKLNVTHFVIDKTSTTSDNLHLIKYLSKTHKVKLTWENTDFSIYQFIPS